MSSNNGNGDEEDWAASASAQAEKISIDGPKGRATGRARGRLPISAAGANFRLPGTASAAGDGQQPRLVYPTVVANVPGVQNNGFGPSTSTAQSAVKLDDSADGPKSAADASLLRKLIHTNIVPTKAELEILQKDPNSPLFSVKSFEKLDLKPQLLKGIYAMGFNAPSKIQETALPMLLSEPPQNMIAQSQSGTGKTAAFVLTMLSRVDTSLPYTQCICLSPTYELALQTGEVAKQMAQFMDNLKIGFAVRGERIDRGKPAPFHIVIGTPGTLLDWCIKFKAIDLTKITVCVLDEADVMIATQGHQDQSLRIKNKTLDSCQMLLFSATYDNDVMLFATKVVKNPNMIRLRRDEESLENVKQLYIECRNDEDKFNALSNIYGTITIGQCVIFCHTKKKVNWLAARMSTEGHSVALLSGELQVEQRAAVINRFREGKERVLITTNVMARGIDVEQVTLVVNFDLPLNEKGEVDCQTYLHRIGRTGRFGKSGIAVNMVDGPRSKQNLEIIRNHFGRPIEKLDSDDIDAIEKLSE